MNIRKIFFVPAICGMLALPFGAYGGNPDPQAAAAFRNAVDNAGLIPGDDDKTIEGVKDKSIKSCVIPEGVTGIGFGTFSHCKELESVTFPATVTGIGDDAFAGCSELTLTIPDSVTGIGAYSLQGVKKVTYAPAFSFEPDGSLINRKQKALVSFAHIAEDFFGKFQVPQGIAIIGAYAFSRCESLEEVTIPQSVTTIQSGAFFRCEALESITIPDGVRCIGDRAFYGCSVLAELTLADSVRKIGKEAFYGCANLREIRLPEKIEYIGENAFSCRGLKQITVPARFTAGDVKKWGIPAGCRIIRK